MIPNPLSILIFLPILAAFLLMFLRSQKNSFFYGYGMLVSLINFLVSIIVFAGFDATNPNFQFVEKLEFFFRDDIKYAVGVDGIAISMIILTTFLIPICLAVSLKSITQRVKEFVVAFLLIEGLVIGSFAVTDLLFFYMFFEATLIPMFLVIGIWGGENRVYAAYKFFIYTLAGSLLFLIAIIVIYLVMGTADIYSLSIHLKKIMPLAYQKWLFLAFFASFAIKVPMFPFHTWLPDAHVQAPTAGSIILAGILIKLGAYGMIRFSLPFFPEASIYYANMIQILGVIAIIYGSLVALMQEDMKKMIAYSSVAHMGFVVIGIFSFTQQGIDGAIMQMISHGVVSAALFLCVGIIYDRLHTKKIKDLGGIAQKMPNFAFLAMIFTMASVGLPGTSGFVGEFLTILGAFKTNRVIAIFAALGVVFGACYMLWLYKRVWFSEITNHHVKSIPDLSIAEFFILGSMAVIVLVLGFAPNIVFEIFSVYSKSLASGFNDFIALK